jgi:hypothetical protein
MKQEITLKVPTSWEAVTLKDYLALRKDMEAYADDNEAVTACLFHHLCHFPVEYLHQMDIDTYVNIKKDLEGFFNKADHKLKRFITIDGVEYGFEPNLSNMAYGAYVDISKYETIGVDEKWAEIMSILYRPVTKKTGALYDTKVYNGELYPEKFMDVGMDVHFGALFFFKNILVDLQKDTLSSLTALTGLHPNIKSVLEKSGVLTQALSNWHKTIS